MRFVAVSLLLISSLAVAQSTARVEGRVLSQAGEPIRKATVRLVSTIVSPGQPPITYIEGTDGAGKFAFENLPPDTYKLFAEHSGFTFPGNVGITLQAGDVKRDVVLKMTAEAAISGRVTDQEGDPVTGAQVTLMRFQYMNGRKQFTYSTVAISDDLGNFRIPGVIPGRYYLMANDMRRLNYGGTELRIGRSAPGVNLPTFYPSAPDLQSAAPLNLTVGADIRGIELRMRTGQIYSIRGRVIDATTGDPIRSSLLLIPKFFGALLRDGGGNTTDGRFEFRGLQPGIYIIHGTRGTNAETPVSLGGRLEVSVTDSNVEGVELRMSPLLEITGTFSMEEGDFKSFLPAPAPPRADGGGAVAGPRAVISLAELDGLGNSAIGPIDEDGTFRIQDVGLSKYAIRLGWMASGGYLKSIRFGGQDVTNIPLDLSTGVGGTLEIVISTRMAEVTATAHKASGDIAPGVAITLWHKTPQPHDPAGAASTLISDPNGTKQFDGLAPGDYYLAAWEEVDRDLLQDPDFLARFESQATVITLKENAKEAVDLKIIARDKIVAEAAKIP